MGVISSEYSNLTESIRTCLKIHRVHSLTSGGNIECTSMRTMQGCTEHALGSYHMPGCTQHVVWIVARLDPQ